MTDGSLATHLPLSALGGLAGHSRRLLLLGIAMIVLGTLGIFASVIFTIASVVFFGWLLLLGGAVLTVHAFSASRWSGFFLQLLSGVLYLLVGWTLITRPVPGAVALTLIYAISLVVQGVFRLGAALATRMDGRGSLLLSGAITLLLGILIWNQWPSSGLWVIGLFLGIDLLFYGWWLVSLALAVRRLPHAAAV